MYEPFKIKNILKTKFKRHFQLLWRIAISAIVVVFIAGIIFGLYVFLFPMTGDDSVKYVLGHGTSHINAPLTIEFLLNSVNAFLWVTPLFILVPFLSLKKFFTNQKDRLFLIWIFVLYFFYFVISRIGGTPIEKYLMILIPAWAILTTSLFMDKVLPFVRKLGKVKTLGGIALFSVAFLVLICLLNSLTTNFYPFHPKSNYFESVISFNWNFFFPVTGSSGPAGFYLSFIAVLFVAIVSALLFLATILLRKKRNIVAILLLLLLSLSISYSVYMYSEYAFGLNNGNVNKAEWTALKYIENNAPGRDGVYVFRNFAYNYYLDKNLQENIIYLDFYNESDTELGKEIVNKDSLVVIVDFPLINKDGGLLQEFNKNCVKNTLYSSKHHELAYSYDCR